MKRPATNPVAAITCKSSNSSTIDKHRESWDNPTCLELHIDAAGAASLALPILRIMRPMMPELWGPYKGIYKTVELCQMEEIHLNYGGGGCEWIEVSPDYYMDDRITSHWIEDREDERERAMLALRIEAVRQDFCTDGN